MLQVQPSIKFVGFDVAEGGSADMRFEIRDEHNEFVGEMAMNVPPLEAGTTDSMLGHGHRQMAAIARSWAKQLDELAVVFESR